VKEKKTASVLMVKTSTKQVKSKYRREFIVN
jgi:hypothetical protein